MVKTVEQILKAIEIAKLEEELLQVQALQARQSSKAEATPSSKFKELLPQALEALVTSFLPTTTDDWENISRSFDNRERPFYQKEIGVDSDVFIFEDQTYSKKKFFGNPIFRKTMAEQCFKNIGHKVFVEVSYTLESSLLVITLKKVIDNQSSDNSDDKPSFKDLLPQAENTFLKECMKSIDISSVPSFLSKGYKNKSFDITQDKIKIDNHTYSREYFAEKNEHFKFLLASEVETKIGKKVFVNFKIQNLNGVKLLNIWLNEFKDKKFSSASVAQPAPVTQSAIVAQPTTVAQPAPVTQSAIVAQPTTVAQPAPVSQPAPVAQPITVVKPTTVAQPITTNPWGNKSGSKSKTYGRK